MSSNQDQHTTGMLVVEEPANTSDENLRLSDDSGAIHDNVHKSDTVLDKKVEKDNAEEHYNTVEEQQEEEKTDGGEEDEEDEGNHSGSEIDISAISPLAENSTADVDAATADLGLTPGQIESLRDAYLVFDRDGDGGITETELKAVVRSMGQKISSEEVHRMFQEVDDDDSGEIDLNEFLQIMSNNMKKANSKQTRLQKAGLIEAGDPGEKDKEDWTVGFELFDVDRDGLISREDLGRVLRNMGEGIKDFELDEMIAEVTSNGETTINFAEFVNVMENGIPL